MPRTPIPIAGVDRAGSDAPQLQTADPAAGNTVDNSDGLTLLIVANTGTVTRNLSIQVNATVDGQPVAARVVPVPAGQQLLCGPYPYWWYGMTLQLDPDSTDLRIGALRLGAALPVAVSAAAFSLSGSVVVANLDAAGLSSSGSVLTVDVDVTASTVDGNALVVTV